MSNKNVSTRPTSETITPLTAAAVKRKRTDSENSDRHQWIKLSVLLGSLILLVISGGWLLHYLSKNPLQTGEVASIPSPVPVGAKKKVAESHQEPTLPMVTADQLAREKEIADQKLAEFLAAKGNLAGKDVANWGEPSYSRMTKAEEAADSAILNKEYTVAAGHYARATSMAKELARRSGEVLTRLIGQGQTALAAGDSALAQQKFATALRIDSSSQVARRGLERARTIEPVTALIASGNQHENNGNLTLAIAEYQKALQLDAHSPEARNALERVNGQKREAQFHQLVSGGLAAFHNKEYPVARKKLIKARTLKPNSPEVLDALSLVNQAVRMERIDTLQKNGQAAEQKEDWQDALKSYQAVFDIDNNIQFASQGKKRAAEQIQIARRIDFFLDKPELLASDDQLKNAGLVLSEAGNIKPQGPKLTERIQKLERLVSIAGTPIKVILESDNLTHVAVYKVGKLGSFEVYELELRPGTYTVVGARVGYRDVRQKIVVKPGRETVHVTVKCKVEI